MNVSFVIFCDLRRFKVMLGWQDNRLLPQQRFSVLSLYREDRATMLTNNVESKRAMLTPEGIICLFSHFAIYYV